MRHIRDWPSQRQHTAPRRAQELLEQVAKAQATYSGQREVEQSQDSFDRAEYRHNDFPHGDSSSQLRKDKESNISPDPDSDGFRSDTYPLESDPQTTTQEYVPGTSRPFIQKSSFLSHS